MQLAELGENSELALVLSHFLRGLCYLRLLCQIDIRSEEELICIDCLMQHTLESCVVFVIGYQKIKYLTLVSRYHSMLQVHCF